MGNCVYNAALISQYLPPLGNKIHAVLPMKWIKVHTSNDYYTHFETLSKTCFIQVHNKWTSKGWSIAVFKCKQIGIGIAEL